MSNILRSIPTVARISLGLVFFVFGLNGFIGFMPNPPVPDDALAFEIALADTGYIFPLLKSVEVVAGLMLLSGYFVPLALTLLAPVIVNIAAFHLFLAPAPGLVVALLGLELYLAWAYRDAFAPMLAARVSPRVASRGDTSSDARTLAGA